MNDSNIKTIDPSELSIHPGAKNLPEWGNEDARFLALVDDIKDRGIDQPLQVDKANQILDGRHRWRAAKRLHLETVPVMIREETDAIGLIVNSLLQRRHYTASARAYLAYPLFRPAMEEARARLVRNFKKGQQIPNANAVRIGEKSVSEFAEMLGVSSRLCELAAEVHKIFEKDPKYKAEMEPRILAEMVGGEHESARPVGLGAVVSGYAGRSSTKKEKRVDRAQLELFEDGFLTITKRLSYWEQFDDAQKNAAVPAIRKMVAEMPQDLRKELAKALKAAEKQDQEGA